MERETAGRERMEGESERVLKGAKRGCRWKSTLCSLSPSLLTWSPPTLANRLLTVGSTVLKTMAVTGVAWDSCKGERERT